MKKLTYNRRRVAALREAVEKYSKDSKPVSKSGLQRKTTHMSPRYYGMKPSQKQTDLSFRVEIQGKSYPFSFTQEQLNKAYKDALESVHAERALGVVIK